jgi:hypothetical protein
MKLNNMSEFNFENKWKNILYVLKENEIKIIG